MADFSKIGKSNVSRSKTHERRIAHLLQDWSGVEFRRRRVEGRDSTTVERESTADVIPVRGDIIFSIEAKCGAKFSLDAAMASPRTAKLTEWWHQTVYDAQLLTKVLKRDIHPLLFFKPIPNWDWIAFSTKTIPIISAGSNKLLFNHLLFDAYGRLGPVSGDVSHSKKHPKIIDLYLDDMVICRWKDFAANVLPETIFVNGLPERSTIENI